MSQGRHVWDLHNEDFCFSTTLVPKTVMMCFSKTTQVPPTIDSQNHTSPPIACSLTIHKQLLSSVLPSHITHSLVIAIHCALFSQLFIEVSPYFTVGASEGRDGLFVCSLFNCTCQDVECFVLLLRLSVMLSGDRQLCSSEKHVKSFFKGFISACYVGMGCKELC